MGSVIRVGAVLLIVFLAGRVPGSAAEGQVRGKVVLDLRGCIARAIATAPEMGEAGADIDLASSRFAEARGHLFPTIEFLGLSGPVPQAKGNQVSSPDSINQNERWTYFVKGDATLIQPLYTFGKISENMRAATHGIEVDRAKKEQARNEIALKVEEYYNGLLLAREMQALLRYVADTLKDSRDKAQKLFDDGSPNVVLEDLYKLDSYRGGVAGFLAEADKGERLAQAALRARLGLAPDSDFDIATTELVAGAEAVADLSASVAAARDKRPEFRQIREGLKAREALVEAARADYFPDIFLAAYLSGAYSEKRDRVNNPWVPDEFNHYWGGVALGLRWKIDFGITDAKVAGKRAEFNRLEYTRSFAETNIPLQVKKYHLELATAEEKMNGTAQGYKNAKKWVVAAVSNFDFGIGPAKEIFDALEQYAKMRAGYFQAVYERNLAKAGLDYATGTDPLLSR
ncbi:MAG TPA: TolC family protein [Geobacteraceae bacterium]|nr:TolC family protein [Geobacteraceae bacterium]